MSTIESYLKARRDYAEARDVVHGIGIRLRDIGLTLVGNPENVVFVDHPVPGDIKGLMTPRPSINWPTPATINDAVVRHYETRKAMARAWAAISDRDREGLAPPENL